MVMHAMQKWMVNININKAQQFAIVCVCRSVLLCHDLNHSQAWMDEIFLVIFLFLYFLLLFPTLSLSLFLIVKILQVLWTGQERFTLSRLERKSSLSGSPNIYLHHNLYDRPFNRTRWLQHADYLFVRWVMAVSSHPAENNTHIIMGAGLMVSNNHYNHQIRRGKWLLETVSLIPIMMCCFCFVFSAGKVKNASNETSTFEANSSCSE